jgi:GH25 family lysozyme M1 (1,4-beta-N-acetylmuramidase)
MRTLGIDVSHWEGHLDWPTVSQVVGFAYFKCTDGTYYVDPTFEANKLGCELAGLPHAPYHYFSPSEDPIAQANHFIDVAGRAFKRYIVDVEEDEGADDHLPANLLSFLLYCQQLTGIKPAIYTSAGYWNEFINPKPLQGGTICAWARNYDLIVAHYTAAHQPTLPIGWDRWVAWQFSDYFFVPGSSSEVDADWFNGTLQECRQYFGNYHLVQPVPVGLQARSLFDQLHVRAEPSIIAKEIEHLSKGDVIAIDNLGGQDVWIRHSRGWTCVEKNGYRYMEVIK